MGKTDPRSERKRGRTGAAGHLPRVPFFQFKDQLSKCPGCSGRQKEAVPSGYQNAGGESGHPEFFRNALEYRMHLYHSGFLQPEGRIRNVQPGHFPGNSPPSRNPLDTYQRRGATHVLAPVFPSSGRPCFERRGIVRHPPVISSLSYERR